MTIKEIKKLLAKQTAKTLVEEFESKLFGRKVTDEDWVKCVEAALLCVDKNLELIKIIGTEDNYSDMMQIKNAVDEM